MHELLFSSLRTVRGMQHCSVTAIENCILECEKTFGNTDTLEAVEETLPESFVRDLESKPEAARGEKGFALPGGGYVLPGGKKDSLSEEQDLDDQFAILKTTFPPYEVRRDPNQTST